MSRIIEYEELKTLSNNQLSELTEGRGVFLYMHDGTMNEVRIKYIVGNDIFSAKFIDCTGLEFYRQNVKRIEILDSF